MRTRHSPLGGSGATVALLLAVGLPATTAHAEAAGAAQTTPMQDVGASKPPATTDQQTSDPPPEPAPDQTPPASPSGRDDSLAIVTPKLQHFIEASYPQAALRARLEGRVVLKLSLGADGRVKHAEVVGYAGHGFDQAARDAARRFHFTPAMRGNTPVAARILYAYDFRLPADSASTAPPEPPEKTAPAPASAPPLTQHNVPEPPTAPAASRVSDASAPAVVVVRGASQADVARRSANAVSVVEMAEAHQQSADLGEVLARNTAVSVQRAGGLGSRGAFALGGLGGERLRFFLDGVPLDLMGYVAGVQNVPVNFVERMEVYQGVVPARFGADALGGAVELVTDEYPRKSSLGATYQLGSFGTHRAGVQGRAKLGASGLFIKSSVFLDVAENDYPVDVEVFDDRGRVQSATLPRFHDGYRGMGSHLSIGVLGQAWANRLVLSAFVNDFHNDVQHGASMQRPYGAVTFDRAARGLNAKYALYFGDTAVSLVAGYAALDTRFRDESNCVYDWRGECLPRALSGEVSGRSMAIDQSTDTFFLRAVVSERLLDDHQLRFSLAPTFADRSGRERTRTSGNDPLEHPRRLLTAVAGVELESSFGLDQLRNIAFVKGYGLVVRSRELLATGDWEAHHRDIFRVGGGDSLRLTLAEEVYAKASYEQAMRQPSTSEFFGDGMLILSNLSLRPETSHNANLGLHLEDYKTAGGSLRGSVGGFGRWSNDLVRLLRDVDDMLRHINLVKARALGVESSLGWTIPGGDWLSLDGRFTYQDLVNQSDQGEYGDRKGERIPNIPYFSGNAAARLRTRALLLSRDTLELSWNLRHVHPFLLGWEGAAQNAKQRLRVPPQTSHSGTLTYSLKGDSFRLNASLEAQNFTDARLYDFYGVQRPGRAYYSKLTVNL